MKTTLCIYVLLGVAWNFSAAAGFKGKMQPLTAVPKLALARSIRATAENGQTSNMTVGFVPLISLIVNLLPRFFGRYSTMTPATGQQSRTFTNKNEFHVKCQEPEHIGKIWPDNLNKAYYYQCYFYEHCSASHQSSCYVMKRHKCKFENNKNCLSQLPRRDSGTNKKANN